MSENDALDRLSKKLNTGDPNAGINRSPLYPKSSSAPPSWDDTETSGASTSIFMKHKQRFSPLEIVFFGSTIFFIIALVAAGFLFFSGQNIVSTKNVDIQISGPAAIGAGNTLSLQVIVTNRNAVPIQLADLVVEFPAGTRSDLNISVAVPRTRVTLGTVNPGESVNRTVRAVLFGQADSEAPIKASVEYRVPSSNAIFVSDTTFVTRISESPASITVVAEKEVVSGQATTLTATVTSNSPQVLKDMLLLATYPPGFSFTSATPAPVGGTATWSLGDIEPAGARTVTIRGVFTGEEGDARVIRFTAGNKKKDSDTDIAAPLARADLSLTVTKPFISAGIALNGSIADQHTIVRGQLVNGQVTWTNNLPVAVQNLSIELAVKGQILDKGSVRVQQGFYNSGSSSMVWDKTTHSDFGNVAPGQSGTLPFDFSTLPLGQGSFKNPTLDFVLTVHANRQSEGNVPETVTATAATKALVATDLTLDASLARGSGPIPPEADTETIYVVTWRVSNSANALANTVVTATLPNYARFIGTVTPVNEAVSYDTNQAIVSWKIGDMAIGASRSVSFSIGVTPSVSQIGSPPPVMTSQRVAGFDRFVQDNVEATAPELNTASAVSSQQDGVVVP